MTLIVLACSLSLSALPPLSQEELKNEAEVVLVGTLGKVERREVEVPDGSDVIYSARFTVTKVEKALVELKQKTVTLEYRSTGRRPPGWTGPSGQHRYPKQGDAIRVFGRFDASGKLVLLEPNGWEPSK